MFEEFDEQESSYGFNELSGFPNLQKIIQDSLEIPETLEEKLELRQSSTSTKVTPERVMESADKLKETFSFFRAYPDVYLDMIKDPKEKFSFHFYQRVFLRAIMRHTYVYGTFPRAYSKSFLSIMGLYLKCMFYPNSKLFIVSDGKEQSARQFGRRSGDTAKNKMC